MRQECSVMIKTVYVHREGKESSQALEKRSATGVSQMASPDTGRDIE
jgi:hypothetical protein